MLCGIIPAMKRLIPILLILLTACTTAPLPVTVLPTPVQTTLVRGPYLQSVTPTSVIVAWETADPAPGVVAYGESAAGERVAADPEVTARHVVTLTGLTPYTLYHYQVFADVIPLGADSIPLSGDFTFRSAAGPDQSRFTFVLFGDTRTQHEVHRAVVERILTWQPDFAIHTGDLVEHGGEAAEWQTFFSIEQELLARTPFFPILGNHEGNSPLYFDLFYLPGNERWYSFDYGNAHFVCLQADNFADLSPESEQVRWLEADLVASDRLWKMAVFHVPAYSSLFREQNDPRTRQVLAPILAAHGVQVAFSGHDHGYQRLVVDGVTYVISAGGGAPLYELSQLHPNLVAHAVAYHALLVTVDGPTLTAVAVSPQGEELDRFTLTAR
jgi:hypothetical protein